MYGYVGSVKHIFRAILQMKGETVHNDNVLQICMFTKEGGPYKRGLCTTPNVIYSDRLLYRLYLYRYVLLLYLTCYINEFSTVILT